MDTAFAPPLYRPRPWLANPHLHTIFSTLMPRPFPRGGPWWTNRREVEFALPDGDRLQGILHLHPDDPGKKRPLALLLHGLEGAADVGYMLGMSHKAFQAGLHSLRLNFRNCGGTEHLAHRFYHSGNTADVVEVLRVLGETWAFGRIIIAGVSFGANMMLQVLGDYGADLPSYITGGVSISAPIDLAMCATALNRGFNRAYERHFILSMGRRLRSKLVRSPRGAELQPLLDSYRKVRTIYDFDHLIVAPHGGFTGADDYYARCSSAERIPAIRCPLLLVHAQDDPFVPFAMYAARLRQWQQGRVFTAFPPRGGHAGFLGLPPPPPAPAWMDGHWAEDTAIAFALQLTNS